MVRALSLLLTLLTGFTGLVYEVAWQKYLATLLGSHSEATAAVLAIFLGGMAIGYELFGRVTRTVVARASAAGQPPRLLRLYGGVECGIGVWALVFPWLFGAVQRISFWVPPGQEALSFAFDVLLCAFLLLPPTILMGGTIPVLTQALSRSANESTRVHAWIYGTNTAGAFAGALAGGFALVPWLGLDGVLRAMGVLNLVAGAAFLGLQGLGSLPLSARGPLASGAAAPTLVASVRPYLFVAFLGGFSIMTLQTIANRIGALSLGSSHFTFAMIASLFVLCIAVGSFAVSALSRIPRALIVASQWALVGLAAALYFAVPRAPYALHVVRALFRDLPEGFFPYHVATFAVLCVVMVLPIALSGALLPLLFHHLRNRQVELGQIAGHLYSANTLGSLVGALLGGYALLFWLDLAEIYKIALAALALSAAIVTHGVLGVRREIVAALGLLSIVGAALLPGWDPAHLSAGAFRSRAPTPQTFQGAAAFYAARPSQLIFHQDDPVATITVTEFAVAGRPSRSIVNNGKSDSNTVTDYSTLCLLSLVPAWLADDPSDSFVVGWGTGVSAGELARLDGVQRVRVAEISPAVIEAAPLFSAWNLAAHTSPKVRLERRDAYRSLLRSNDRYGVIVSEPSNPWVTGVEMLYSREFLEAARDRLTPGGVYAQWMHAYETDAATVALVAQTYAAVFDQVAVWFTGGTDLVLLGFRSQGGYPSEATLRERLARPDFSRGFASCGTPSWNELAAHEILPPGVLSLDPEARIHTLRHPLLSSSAARAFFSGGGAGFPRLADLSRGAEYPPRGLHAESAPRLDEAALEAVSQHVCNVGRSAECVTWHAYWMQRWPGSQQQARAWRKLPDRVGGEAARLQVERLAALYRGEAPSLPTRDPLARARMTALLFGHHYVHAIPFPPQALRRAWSACERSRNRHACDGARRDVEAQLGFAGPD